MVDEFEQVFGFKEGPDYKTTRANLLALIVKDQQENPVIPLKMRLPGGEEVDVGEFTTPSVEALHQRAMALSQDLSQSDKERLTPTGDGHFSLVLAGGNGPPEGDAYARHYQSESKGAVFQAASQFNCLEMPGPNVTPDRGIKNYINDRTQGPACARAAYVATAFRNYLADVAPSGSRLASTNIGMGQGASGKQLNLLQEAMLLAGSPPLVDVTNGYTDTTPAKIETFNTWLANPVNAEKFRQKLRVGIHANVGIVDKATGKQTNQVTQTFNSAIAMNYSALPSELWEPIAKQILLASYQATLVQGVINNMERAKAGLPPAPVELTKVGGGVFGNQHQWIKDAIVEATKSVAHYHVPLTLKLIGFSAHEEQYLNLPKEIEAIKPGPSPKLNSHLDSIQLNIHNQAIFDAISALHKSAVFKTVGIFRLAGNKHDLDNSVSELLDPLTQNQTTLSNISDNTILMAVTLKQLLRDREQIGGRLFSNSAIQVFSHARKLPKAERLLALGEQLKQLPDEDKLILNGLLDIADKVFAEESKNKMTYENIAIAIGPSLFEEAPIAKDLDPMAAMKIAQEKAKEAKNLNADLQFIMEHRAKLTHILQVDDAKAIQSDIKQSVDDIYSQANQCIKELTQTIENTDWQVGIGGGKNIILSDLTEKKVPTHVAELYKVCISADDKGLSDSVQKAQSILESRNDNSGPWQMLKSIFKKLDVFNLFSRRQSTEAFYESTEDKFAALKSVYLQSTGDMPEEADEEESISHSKR